MNPSVPTRLGMLGRSTRLKDRLNPNCPNCPSLLKKMREESSTDTPSGLFPSPRQFSENPRSHWDSWDRQIFQYFSGTSTFYRLGRAGTAQIPSPSLGRQYSGLIPWRAHPQPSAKLT